MGFRRQRSKQNNEFMVTPSLIHSPEIFSFLSSKRFVFLITLVQQIQLCIPYLIFFTEILLSAFVREEYPFLILGVHYANFHFDQ